MSFEKACKDVKGRLGKKDGVKVCKLGGDKVDSIFYKPDDEMIIVKDHNDRETKIEKVDELSSGTLWMIIDTPNGNAVVTNPDGREPSFDNYIGS